MIILGVDPGSHATGYGVIQIAAGRLSCLDAGTIRAPKQAPLPERLRVIHEALLAIIDDHAPEVMAVEDVFNARNARSSLVLGQARGAVLLAGSLRGLAVETYAPREIKMAVTGNGAAVKEQLRWMVTRLLALPQPPASLDASDALGAAVCHAMRAAGPCGRMGAGA